VAQRVSPSERVLAEIDTLFSSDADLTSVLEEVGRLTVRLLMQQAVESEVDVFLARRPYERRVEHSPAGSRNGWQPPAAVKTTMGRVELSRPKLRGTDEKFCSQLFGTGVTRTHALEALVVSAWVRGLSDRDIEAALKEVLGEEAALSRSTVSRICQQVKDDFDECTPGPGRRLQAATRPRGSESTLSRLQNGLAEARAAWWQMFGRPRSRRLGERLPDRMFVGECSMACA
jgi:putative transposase